MALNIRNARADELARELAEMEQKPITEAVVIALEEAIRTRMKRETASETAARLMKKFGLSLPPGPLQPLSREEMNEMNWQDDEMEYNPERS